MTGRHAFRNLFVCLLVLIIIGVSSGSLCFGGEVDDIRIMLWAKGHRWRAGETSMSRLPLYQRQLRCGHIKPRASVSHEMSSSVDSPSTGVSETVSSEGSVSSGSGVSVDWRSMGGQNFVTPIRDQGNCGSCWAFATTGALESYVLIKENLPALDENRAEEILLSCSGAGSCNGGYIGSASEYIRGTGLPPESYFAYTVSSGDDSCSRAQTGWQASTYKIGSWSYVTDNRVSLEAIKSALANGPVVTTMDVYNDFFSYQDGIYEYSTGALAGGHAVLVVGYVDDQSVNGGGYFIVKNSWGADWGEGGYFNIAYSQINSPVGFGEWTITYHQGVTPPVAPSSLTATPLSTSSIGLTWSDAASNEAGFKIERCAGSECTDFAQVAAVGSNTTTYTSSGLQAGAAYTFRIRAYNGGGDSSYSNQASGTTFTEPTPPSAPSNLSGISVSRTRINLSWTDTSSDETGFRIERCTGLSCSNFRQIAAVGANVVQYSNTGLKKGTTYRYRVRAYNSIGTSDYSNSVSVAALTVPVTPYAPTNLSGGSVSQTRIDLSWVDGANNEDGFRIERCTGATCSRFAQIASVGANTIQYSNMRLKKGTTYKYRLRAYNSDGKSAYSGIMTIETPR